jgi:hypothetical protein
MARSSDEQPRWNEQLPQPATTGDEWEDSNRDHWVDALFALGFSGMDRRRAVILLAAACDCAAQGSV